jgi:hypothetical protein
VDIARRTLKNQFRAALRAQQDPRLQGPARQASALDLRIVVARMLNCVVRSAEENSAHFWRNDFLPAMVARFGLCGLVPASDGAYSGQRPPLHSAHPFACRRCLAREGHGFHPQGRGAVGGRAGAADPRRRRRR